MKDECIFDGLPTGQGVIEISSVSLLVDPAPHPFYLDQAENIHLNWMDEVTKQPALYDGQMLLHRDISLKNGALAAVSHLVPFSAFLWWRKQPKREGAAHLFASAVILSADGAIIAVRMSNHTANPGKVYCAAGSLDRSDIVGDSVDFEANMAREVKEETGLDLINAEANQQIYGLWRDRSFTLFRYYQFHQSAEDLLQIIRKNMIEDHEQEIAAPVAIWSADPAAHDYGHFMPFVLDHYFHTLRSGETA